MRECPYIVDILASQLYQDTFDSYIFLELADIDLGHLCGAMRLKNVKLTAGHLNFILDNTTRAIEFMHKQRVCHGNITDINILYFFNKSILKITDFNLLIIYPSKKMHEYQMIQDMGKVVTIIKSMSLHLCPKKAFNADSYYGGSVSCSHCDRTSARTLEVIKEMDWEDDMLRSVVLRMFKDPQPGIQPITPAEIYGHLTPIEKLPHLLPTHLENMLSA